MYLRLGMSDVGCKAEVLFLTCKTRLNKDLMD